MAFLLLESRCPLSVNSLIIINGSEVPQINDSDPATCLTMDDNTRKWIQILLPYIKVKGQFYVSLMGNLKCSPIFGFSVSIRSDCESDTRSYSRCIARDLITSGGSEGCKYQCHSLTACSNHIIVDIAGFYGIALSRTLCEIGV